MKLIKTKDYLLLVEKVKDFKNGDWNYEIDNCIPIYKFNYDIDSYPGNRILAYYKLNNEAEELDLPLLPDPFKENINDIVDKLDDELVRYSTEESEYWSHWVIGVKDGYKAAKAKQFTLEDVEKSFKAGQMFELYDDYPNFNTFLESLSTQQLPTEFTPEYEDKIALDGHTIIGRELKIVSNQLIGKYK